MISPFAASAGRLRMNASVSSAVLFIEGTGHQGKHTERKGRRPDDLPSVDAQLPIFKHLRAACRTLKSRATRGKACKRLSTKHSQGMHACIDQRHSEVRTGSAPRAALQLGRSRVALGRRGVVAMRYRQHAQAQQDAGRKRCGPATPLSPHGSCALALSVTTDKTAAVTYSVFTWFMDETSGFLSPDLGTRGKRPRNPF